MKSTIQQVLIFQFSALFLAGPVTFAQDVKRGHLITKADFTPIQRPIVVPVLPAPPVPPMAPLAPMAIAEAEASREGCHPSDSKTLCLALNYVVYRQDSAASDEPESVPIVSEKDAVFQLEGVNQLWKTCDIQFQIDQYRAINPIAENLRYHTADYLELDEIRRRFASETSLLVVMTGKWDRVAGTLGHSWANAWTNVPGTGVYGAILEQSVSDNPHVIGHELGHYLSLEHDDAPNDLMHPLISSESSLLTPAQCDSARSAVSYFWEKMLR